MTRADTNVFNEHPVAHSKWDGNSVGETRLRCLECQSDIRVCITGTNNTNTIGVVDSNNLVITAAEVATTTNDLDIANTRSLQVHPELGGITNLIRLGVVDDQIRRCQILPTSRSDTHFSDGEVVLQVKDLRNRCLGAECLIRRIIVSITRDIDLSDFTNLRTCGTNQRRFA